ncbi:MAG: hypothetical protein IJA54_02870 [Tyzzerella sp.]|nr:hypothetical protein [Tyzzerella sp.]
MSDISIIDSNFKVQTNLKEQDIQFYNVNCASFQVCGVFYENGKFRRMPEIVAKNVSDGVFCLHVHAAGGRVRFKTDSSYVAIHAKMSNIGKMPHFALTGSAGFDLYANNHYISTFVVPFDINDGYESIIHFQSNKMREITINFPLYSSVDELYVGISDQAELYAPEPYRVKEPIVYYGSSITQGGCASRPGMSYESIVSRRLNADFINLGFSGNAKGEDKIGEYISGLKMSCFVYDYDHNAPSVEHLKNTHEKMFKRIRRNNPNIPIVIMSRPKFDLTEDEMLRLDVIKTTYKNAVENGDKNVYLIEGRTLMEMAGDEGTVDNCHPNDFGFASMAKVVGDVLAKILN